MTQFQAPEEIYGVSVISGLWGVGKTTLAMTCEDPSKVTMLDFDQKSKKRAEAMGMQYHSPAEIGLTDPLEYDLAEALQWFRETVKGLDNGRTTLIIDNGSPVEEAFGALVAKNPQRYGVRPGNVTSGKFGGVNPGVGKLWESTVNYLQAKGYERIFVIMHMSQVWTNSGPVPNKYKVKGNKTLNQLSNLSLLLIRADDAGAPDALVMKEALGITKFDPKKGFTVVRGLPPRIPNCDWPKIRGYVDTAGERNGYAPSEIPSTFEMSCYGQFMSPEQTAFIKAVASNPTFSMTEGDGDDQKPMKWATMRRFIKQKGWKEEECKKLLLEEFGAGYDEQMAPQYIAHLQSFYDNSRKEVAQAA
ncbi:AAA family ATPase [Chloroflexota bacterium]